MNAVSDKKISELKKKINLLEWDITQVINISVKKMKEEQLNECKKELKKLQNPPEQNQNPTTKNINNNKDADDFEEFFKK